MTVALLSSALALNSCSRPATNTDKPLAQVSPADMHPTPGDWVIREIPSDPDTLNAVTSQDETSHTIMNDIYDGLLNQNTTTLKLEPSLAQSYEISPDQLVYTFHLRHDVKWHDGQPFTAEDVKFTFDKVRDPAVDAAPARVYFADIKSCEVLDPYTVRFTSTKRYYKTLEVIGSGGYLPIMPKHCYPGSGADFNRSDVNRHPVGTGPYKFVRWDTGAQVVLERNDQYWGSVQRYPKRLVYQVIQEPSVAVQLLKKGDLDLIEAVPPIQWEREIAHSSSVNRLQKIVFTYPAYSYLGFNLRQPMFSDVRVRHAIDLLIPRAEILRQIYLNQYANLTSGYEIPASPDYNQSILPTPEDPVLALKLLNEAGWKNDHGDGILYRNGLPLSFSLMYRSGSDSQEKMAELMQESFSRVGVQLKLDRIEALQLIERTEDWKFDACMYGWALDIDGDPFQLWDGSQADIKKSSNFIGYNSATANKLIAAGREEYDPVKRAAIFQQLHRVIHNDYPCCFLFNPHEILLISNRFQGVSIFVPRPCYDPGLWWVPRPLQKYK